jgi:hypothetical protein
MGALSGWVVLALMTSFYVALVVIGGITFRLRKAAREVPMHYDLT